MKIQITFLFIAFYLLESSVCFGNTTFQKCGIYELHGRLLCLESGETKLLLNEKTPIQKFVKIRKLPEDRLSPYCDFKVELTLQITSLPAVAQEAETDWIENSKVIVITDFSQMKKQTLKTQRPCQ